MNRTLFAAGVLACLTAGQVWAQDASCRFQANRAGGTDLAGVEKVVIRAGAGDLKVVGRERAVRLEARGQACASSQELLDKIRLHVRREGSIAYVETEMPQDDGVVLIGSWYATLDLGVALPASLPVDAQGSSGDAVLEGLSGLTIADSSGDLTVRDIAGELGVEDSSGEVRIERVGGLRLRDSSGDVTIREVARDVEIEADSSGDLEIASVGGSVRVRQDSSGDIRITDVQGDAEVDVDSSGGIAARNVGGDFTVGSDGSGGIDYSEVRGRVTVPQSAP